MSKNPIDDVLKNALSSTDTPGYELNKNTKIMMRERVNMKQKTKFSLKFAMVIAAVLIVSSIGVYAAVKYLTPNEVAHQLKYPKLAAAFESKDSIVINETASSGGYDVTLLGVVFGKDLIDFAPHADVERTYAILAIEKQDGKMPDTSSDEYGEQDFFISPLIKGYKPWQVNIFTMGGGSSSFVVDGIMYRMIECDSVEMFADAGIYIGISSNGGPFCNNQSFNYNDETGEITPNLENGSVSVIFNLPVDKSKADPVKVREFLETQDLINNDNPTEEPPLEADTTDNGVEIDTIHKLQSSDKN